MVIIPRSYKSISEILFENKKAFPKFSFFLNFCRENAKKILQSAQMAKKFIAFEKCQLHLTELTKFLTKNLIYN